MQHRASAPAFRHRSFAGPIWLALEELGEQVSHGVYIGDSPFDTMSANAAGVTSIGVTWGASSVAALQRGQPRHVVTSVSELDALLTKLGDGYGT